MTHRPDIWCCRVVELAVRLLPAEHRAWYGLEFVAELYGMPKAQQRRHSARVLTSAWALRTALGTTAAGAPSGLHGAVVLAGEHHPSAGTSTTDP